MSGTSQLSHLLDAACARQPDALALEDGERRVGFAELHDMAARLGAAFADAQLAGERVATLLPNGVELVACYLGCWAAGAIAVPFEYVDAPPEIHAGLVDSGARWLIVHAEKLRDLAAVDLTTSAVEQVFVVGELEAGRRAFSELLATSPRALPDVSAESLAFILYTSGSTALPKGVTHSHASAVGIVESVLAALGGLDASCTVVAQDSVSHMGGWIEVFPALAAGARVVLLREFAPASFCAALRRFRPTVAVVHVDPLWQLLRDAGTRRDDFSSLRGVFTGGDELPLPLQHAFLDRTGLPIQVGWGMTEAIWLTLAREPELTRRGYMGRPLPEVQLRLVSQHGHDVPDGESGELWAKGPMVSPGYWNQPDADRAVFVDGWIRTGDMGQRDERGDYWFTGRLKQLIERNSENITPGEIEQALYRHPAVREAGAFGVDDPDEGQVPIAYVVLASGADVTESELKTFLASQIAAFKIPARILSIERLPLTHSGKIDHKALADQYATDPRRKKPA